MKSIELFNSKRVYKILEHVSTQLQDRRCIIKCNHIEQLLAANFVEKTVDQMKIKNCLEIFITSENDNQMKGN